MSKLFFLVCILMLSALAFAAPILTWDGSAGAEGYNLYCAATPVVATPAAIDAGAGTSYDIAALVTPGVELECWVTAYAAGLPESADSNHIRLTPPSPVQTLVVPAAPNGFTLTW